MRNQCQIMERILNKEERSAKLRDPPVWGTESFTAWKRRVLLWAEDSNVPEKKASMLIEQLKKDEDHKGLKDLITHEVIENNDFNYRS